jgi:hypothetical protein
VQGDLGDNGALDNAVLKASLAQAAANLDPALVAVNLSQRYASLGVTFSATDISNWIDQDGDGIVGKFEFQVADAAPSSTFTFPTYVTERLTDLSVAASAGQLSVNGAPVTGAVSVHAGDVLSVSPNAGSFPNGVLPIFLTVGTTQVARVEFVSGLLAIEVTPQNQNVAKGLLQQFTATATFSDNRTADITASVSWSSSAPWVASISLYGLARAEALGTATIRATSGAVSGSSDFTTTAALLQSFTVSPARVFTGVSKTRQPVITGTYSDGTTANISSLASWSSNDPAVATVDAQTGLITGVALGSAGIDVTVGSLTQTVPVDVVGNVWSPGTNLAQGRRTHTATLLANGKVLVAGRVGFAYSGNEIYDPTTGTWAPAGAFSLSREGHTATLLPDGRVVVTGGVGYMPAYTYVEIYNPALNQWSAGANMSLARTRHSATLLPNGTVLVVGGSDQPGVYASAEIYNPASNSWSAAASLTTSRASHTATLLANGTVLVVGGAQTQTPEGSVTAVTGTAEIYDPSTNTWSPAASLSSARERHTATALSDGRVLVTGGMNMGVRVAGAEIYDPATNTWSPAGTMSEARIGHTATLLDSGNVLVIGGLSAASQYLSSTEVYDPAANTWAAGPSLGAARKDHTATRLLDGTVIVIGGGDASTAYLPTTELYW